MSGEAEPIHDGLFRVGDDGEPHLVGGRCPACGDHHFPLGPGCPYCGAAPVDEVSLSTTGELWGFTTVTTAPPGYHGPVPFGFGVVELPEGLRVITRLPPAPRHEHSDDRDHELTDPGHVGLQVGLAMRLTTETVAVDADGTERTTWCFVPAGAP
jgi:uncharacterized protein